MFRFTFVNCLLTLQRLTNFRSHMKRSTGISKTIKIALIPMIKTIMASNLPQNPQKTKLADLKCTSGKWLFYIFRYTQLQNIFKKFASLIWQKFLQAICFAHLAKEVTFRGGFFGLPNFVLFRLLWEVGCCYTYNVLVNPKPICPTQTIS